MTYTETMIQKADQYIDQEAYRNAIDIYSHLIERHPDSARFYALRGYCYSMQNEHEAALRDYSSALVLKPNAATTLYQRALTYERLDQYKNALSDYQKSGTISAQYDVFFNIGRIYRHQREFEKARKYYQQALLLNPEHQSLNKAMESLMRDIKKDSGLRIARIPSRDADIKSIVRTAQSYIECGNCEEAHLLYDSLAEKFPQSAWPYCLRGICFFYMADYDAALLDFTVALSFAPDNTSILFNRAKTYAKQGRYSEAISDLQKSWTLSPRYDILLFLGMIYIGNAKYGEARKAYLKALQLNPRSHKVSIALNSLMRKVELVSGLRAENCKSDQYTSPINSMLEKAQLFIKKGECECAISLYDSLLKKCPKENMFYYMRGRCFFFMADYCNALKDFLSELDLNENNPDALFNSALAYAALGQFDHALEHLRKSEMIRPDADINLHIGIILKSAY